MALPLLLPWFMRGDLRRRARQIGSTLAKHGLQWMAVQFGVGIMPSLARAPREHATSDVVRQTQAIHLRSALEELGATFIKLGQAASTRPDLIPREYADELAKLQDAAPPVPTEAILAVIQEELHQSPHDLFAEFDPKPIASASIGQVHAARLKNGDDVVVKVQRPGIAEQIEQDLMLLTAMTEWAEAHSGLARDYRLSALVDEFAHTIHAELDYRAEGRNADTFRRNFIGEPTVTIPRVYWKYTTGRVLTMQRVGGIKISDTEALDRAHIDRHLVAENSVRLMLREAFEFGFFHADAHAGNFFVRPDGGIVMVDFGMVGHLTAHVQDVLLEILLSLVRQDPERLTDDLFALGIATSTADRAHLKRDLEYLVTRYATSPMKELAAGPVINELLSIAFRHRLVLPNEIVLLSRVIIESEGLGVMLDPNFQLLSFAAPLMQEIWKKKRSPEVLAGQMAQGVMDATEISLQLPRQIARLLGQLERGTLQVNISQQAIRELSNQLQRMVNRIALSVVLAGTIMGLGLVMVAYHPAAWEPIGGWIITLAFIGSLIFGALLMWSIFRTGGH